jgi:hypothetical protein
VSVQDYEKQNERTSASSALRLARINVAGMSDNEKIKHGMLLLERQGNLKLERLFRMEYAVNCVSQSDMEHEHQIVIELPKLIQAYKEAFYSLEETIQNTAVQNIRHRPTPSETPQQIHWGCLVIDTLGDVEVRINDADRCINVGEGEGKRDPLKVCDLCSEDKSLLFYGKNAWCMQCLIIHLRNMQDKIKQVLEELLCYINRWKSASRDDVESVFRQVKELIDSAKPSKTFGDVMNSSLNGSTVKEAVEVALDDYIEYRWAHNKTNWGLVFEANDALTEIDSVVQQLLLVASRQPTTAELSAVHKRFIRLRNDIEKYYNARNDQGGIREGWIRHYTVKETAQNIVNDMRNAIETQYDGEVDAEEMQMSIDKNQETCREILKCLQNNKEHAQEITLYVVKDLEEFLSFLIAVRLYALRRTIYSQVYSLVIRARSKTDKLLLFKDFFCSTLYDFMIEQSIDNINTAALQVVNMLVDKRLIDKKTITIYNIDK